ncbi:ABC transporter permease [Rothia kristinae]|uniref:ABC transporter permease n=1 Tax=Rothia kristinae TaxID=37923 RepID=UPI00244B558C|nr:ABC transporter permease [Rothia kristinae]WGH09746.1 ABC transporter permease [Rothia kristinae]
MSSTDITSSPAAAGAPDAERPGPPLSDARTRARHPGARTGAALLRRPGTVLAGLFVLLMIGWVLFPGLFATADPTEIVGDSLAAPSWQHWFGTDLNGRDVYSRVVYGARVSLRAGVLAITISLVVGGLLGMLAGSVGGWVDAVISRSVEVIVSIPGLLLSLALISVLGFGVTKVAIAVGISGIPGFVRIARAETLRVSAMPYMDAARTSGTRRFLGLFSHVVPNAAGPVAVVAGIDLGGAILSIAALSFLGFGAVPPTAEWGSQINEGRLYVASAWWWSICPAIIVALTVLSANRLTRSIGTREV